MKLSYWILVASSALFSFNAAACEPGALDATARTMSLQQAQDELTSHLFSAATQASDLGKDGANVVNQIDCYLATQALDFAELDEFRGALYKRGSALFAAATKIEQNMLIEGINASVNRDAGTGFVVFPNSSNDPYEINLYDDVLANYCDDQTSLKCGTALQLAKGLWWIAGQYRSFANEFNQNAIAQSLAFNDRLERQWRSYKDDTIKLWPQEVLLNSLVYRPAERGLSAPPSFKLLTLRPSIGLSYLSDQSHHVQPTINVDLLGVYWWRYQDAEAGPGRGLSASLVWDGDDTAYGLTYHHSPKWSVTLAQGDENDTVVSISFQLAYWFLQR